MVSRQDRVQFTSLKVQSDGTVGVRNCERQGYSSAIDNDRDVAHLRVGFVSGSGTVDDRFGGMTRDAGRTIPGFSKGGKSLRKGLRQGTMKRSGEVPAALGRPSLALRSPPGSAARPRGDREQEVKGCLGNGCARSGRMAGIDGERGSERLGFEVLGTHRGSESQKCMFYKGLRCE